MQASYTLKRPPLDSRVEVKLTTTVRDVHRFASALNIASNPRYQRLINPNELLAVGDLGRVLRKVAESITDHLEDLETEVRVELEEPFRPVGIASAETMQRIKKHEKDCEAQRVVPRYEEHPGDPLAAAIDKGPIDLRGRLKGGE